MQAELAELSYSALVTRATQECIEATTISSSETSDNLKQCKAALIAIIMEKKHFGIVPAGQSPGSSSGALSKSVQGQTGIQPQRPGDVLKASFALMDKLKKGEGSHSIKLSSELNAGQRAQLHKRAATLGLETKSQGPDKARIMCVWSVTRGNTRSRSPQRPHQTEPDAGRARLAELAFNRLVTRATNEGIEATPISTCETRANLESCKDAIIDIIMDKKLFGIRADSP